VCVRACFFCTQHRDAVFCPPPGPQSGKSGFLVDSRDRYSHRLTWRGKEQSVVPVWRGCQAENHQGSFVAISWSHFLVCHLHLPAFYTLLGKGNTAASGSPPVWKGAHGERQEAWARKADFVRFSFFWKKKKKKEWILIFFPHLSQGAKNVWGSWGTQESGGGGAGCSENARGGTEGQRTRGAVLLNFSFWFKKAKQQFFLLWIL